MNKWAFFFLFGLTPAFLHAQLLQGRVYRFGTDSLIPHASVYYNASMQGTSTDEYGIFRLPMLAEKIPIVISCIGYTSAVISDYNPASDLKVYLIPKVQPLREVSISYGGLSRMEKMRMFEREFLGISQFSAGCRIINPDDIELDYSKRSQTLTAYSSKPILIENKKLGYRITYFLDRFKKERKMTNFAGNYIFKDTGLINKRILKNREEAYSGSRMQFIRALWSGQLNNNNFKIYTSYLKPLTSDSILVTGQQKEKFIQLRYPIVIIHDNDNTLSTHLSQNESNTLITRNGFYGTGLQWFGFMGTQRVGDMLPFEYEPLKGSLLNVPDNPDPAESTLTIDPKILASTNFDRFKPMILRPNNHKDTRLVIKKWNIPIHYQIYGSLGSRAEDSLLRQKAKRFFNLIARICNLEINEAKSNKEVNFLIISGGVNKLKNTVSNEVTEYLEGLGQNGGSYSFDNENGFNQVFELIASSALPGTLSNKWAVIKSRILAAMGINDAPKADSESLDHLTLKALNILYSPVIKTGMSENELAAAFVKAHF